MERRRMHVTELETASMAGVSPDQGANEMLGALGKRFVRIVGAIDDIASDVRGYVARPALGAHSNARNDPVL
jgi:hypothetical protein